MTSISMQLCECTSIYLITSEETMKLIGCSVVRNISLMNEMVLTGVLRLNLCFDLFQEVPNVNLVKLTLTVLAAGTTIVTIHRNVP